MAKRRGGVGWGRAGRGVVGAESKRWDRVVVGKGCVELRWVKMTYLQVIGKNGCCGKTYFKVCIIHG